MSLFCGAPPFYYCLIHFNCLQPPSFLSFRITDMNMWFGQEAINRTMRRCVMCLTPSDRSGQFMRTACVLIDLIYLIHSQLHFDSAPNLYALVRGRKHFLLYSPADTMRMCLRQRVATVHSNGVPSPHVLDIKEHERNMIE